MPHFCPDYPKRHGLCPMCFAVPDWDEFVANYGKDFEEAYGMTWEQYKKMTKMGGFDIDYLHGKTHKQAVLIWKLVDEIEALEAKLTPPTPSPSAGPRT